MLDEKYNLVCRGEVIDGTDKAIMIPQLEKLFNTDEKSVSKIFTPKLKILVKNLSWQKATKYQAKLKEVGLIVYLDIALNAEIFREGLTPSSKYINHSAINQNASLTLAKEGKPAEKSTTYLLLKFNRKKLIPAMMYPPSSEILADDNESKTFIVQSYNYSINTVFILIVSLFAALLIQKYFTMTMVIHITTPMVTVISILMFFMIIFLLPKIMTPNRIFTLRQSISNEPYLLCRQMPSLNIFVSRYEVFNRENILIAYITHNKLKSYYECVDEHANILFTSSEEHDIDDFTMGVTEDLREELFDLYFLKYIRSIADLFKKFDSWLKKQPQSYLHKDGFLIRDNNAKKAATFYREKISAIELPEHYHDNDRFKILSAFSLVCVGLD